MPLSAVAAASGCLIAPKGEAPAGQHWYYRIEHSTKRHCWSLREEIETSRAATPPSARRAAPAATGSSEATTLTPADADARAEMPSLQGSVEDDPQIAPRTPPVPFIDVGGAAQPLPNNAPLDSAQSLVASRWPGQTAVPALAGEQPASPSSSFAVAAANTDANATTDTNADLTPTGALAAPPAAAAATTTEETPATGTLASLQTLLVVTLGALMFTGLTGSTVYLLARARPQPSRGATREPYWLPAPADRTPPPWLEPLAIDPARDAEARSLEHLTRVSGIEPLLARLANRAQTGPDLREQES